MASEDIAQVQDVAAGAVTGTTGVAKKIRGATVNFVSSGVLDVQIFPGDPQASGSPFPGINLAGPDLDGVDAFLRVQALGTLPTFATVAHSSDTVKRVTLQKQDGTVREADFEFLLSRISDGGSGNDVAQVQEIAAAIVDGATSTVRKIRGCTFSKIGTGVYEFTLDPSLPGGPELAEIDSVSGANLVGTEDGHTINIQHVSGSVKRVLVFDTNGSAADAEFSVAFGRLAGSGGPDTAVLQDVCAASVQGDGTVNKKRGCVIARTGTGVYTVTINPVAVDGETVTQQGNLAGGLAAAEAVMEVQPIGLAGVTASVINTSDTVKTVRITDDAVTPAPTDSDFCIRFRKLLG